MINSIADNFIIYGDYVRSKPFGSGHINDTRLVTFNEDGREVNYIFRKINKNVFKNPEIVVSNTLLVTEHIRTKLEQQNENDILRKVVALIQAKDGKYFYVDENDGYWSVLRFIEDSYTVDFVETTEQAYQAAKAFGEFTKQLSDIDVSGIKETIPNYHNLKSRLKTFDDAVQIDAAKRVNRVTKEINAVDKNRNLQEEIAILLNNGIIPIRIVHNDTKINNVMLDDKTGKGLAVIDLDTVMPGTVLFDFGDMIRSSTSPVEEDKADYEEVKMRINIFEAIVQGYLSELKDVLTKSEIENLVYGAEVIVYEQAVRFLTDYILGDVYYGIAYEDHNLVRAKNQFALLDSIQEQKEEMEKIVKKYI
ncbi:N-acetylhexosamine 1-kinase [hydrothermal vent metagenome]|uniref:N-acetylhexosamine 1-kinase n=1 Tax=hydrothermal vent metagenome TaxID=652676 RepID=A0A3B1CFS3_9ZZZZ